MYISLTYLSFRRIKNTFSTFFVKNLFIFLLKLLNLSATNKNLRNYMGSCANKELISPRNQPHKQSSSISKSTSENKDQLLGINLNPKH